ncbi:membrane protein [Sporosarcina sp. NCCP-2222]|uniref:YndJ family protein n=1 Tax=Sporosarcina sp. NCCP-2222 TaxID=2935073 RepID=UPI0020840192|nr:YndJ family protein [Sporosarcina sp. NCCP-2222]GKV55873.1 membrane protein [Sporosarcina sp. NCCP-2222]
MSKFVLSHLLLFLFIALASTQTWPFLLLTAAQIVYVPIMLKLVMKDDGFAHIYLYFAIPAYVSVAFLQITHVSWAIVPAGIYLLYTLAIAFYGVTRFCKRGFTNAEELSIDLGLIYLAMGGAWFFAFIGDINTGFSPLLTWLTAIHFHYSAFLLPIFIGLAGRISKPARFTLYAGLLLIAPMLVAIGITFSRWIELLSVLVYIIGLVGMNFIVWRLKRIPPTQKWLIRVSFASLVLTILFSLLYVLGNGFGLTSMTIDDMLRFHGILNCIIFALFGVAGWLVNTPEPVYQPPSFPISNIRGKQVVEQLGTAGSGKGLVDDMKLYQLQGVAPQIADFYENTREYRLLATVRWHAWFKPFAWIYSWFSRRTEQINLPTHGRQVEMTGDVIQLHDQLDDRENVRAWIRKVEKQYAFIALYSSHYSSEGKPYMNIALPLPFTNMTGVLELIGTDQGLILTSERTFRTSDAGIYLIGKKGYRFRLPLEERFKVIAEKNGTLQAVHKMKLFAIPFLTIDYTINKK